MDDNEIHNVSVQLGRKLFSFTNHQHWVTYASRYFASNGATNKTVLCLDQKGRVVEQGSEFMRARDENTFPVDVYLLKAEYNSLHTKFLKRMVQEETGREEN